VNHPVPAVIRGGLPDPERPIRLARLENEITELAAHINAATYQLLNLICEYDEQTGWGNHGVASCAHWLQWQCGTNIGTAREKVRVARALPELPKISESFSKGRISYSKVRAMTRVATPKNEEYLLHIAHHGTAAHVETVVSNYSRGKRLEILFAENNRHAHRELSWYMDGDGMWVFKGKFTAEQGALIKKALEGAMEDLFEEQRNEPSDISAETPQGVDPVVAKPHPIATRRADAMERVAETFLAGETGERSGGDRYLVNIHTEGDTLTANGEGAESECEDCGNAGFIQSENTNMGFQITSETLPPLWRGEIMDQDLAQLGMQSLE
jgi:hypothetical protein